MSAKEGQGGGVQKKETTETLSEKKNEREREKEEREREKENSETGKEERAPQHTGLPVVGRGFGSSYVPPSLWLNERDMLSILCTFVHRPLFWGLGVWDGHSDRAQPSK